MSPQIEFVLWFIGVGAGTIVCAFAIDWIRLHASNFQRRPDTPAPSKDDPNGPSANFAALIHAIRAEGRANRAEEKREDRSKKFREWLTIILLVVTVYFLHSQVEEMRAVYGPIKDQADAAKRTAENSRAWVGPLNASFVGEPTVGTPLEIIVFYSNSGHDPASGFVNFVSPFVIPITDEAKASARIEGYLSECKKLTNWPGGSVVYPSVGGGFGGVSNGFQVSTKTPPDFVTTGVAKGEDTIIVQGCFGYRTSGIERHSYFCYFYRHETTKIQNLNICLSGHYAD